MLEDEELNSRSGSSEEVSVTSKEVEDALQMVPYHKATKSKNPLETDPTFILYLALAQFHHVI